MINYDNHLINNDNTLINFNNRMIGFDRPLIGFDRSLIGFDDPALSGICNAARNIGQFAIVWIKLNCGSIMFFVEFAIQQS